MNIGNLITGDLFTGIKINPRIRSRTFYKRVALVFLRPPAPVWSEIFSPTRWAMRPISYDGRYWIETTFKHGAIQTAVCREGYPKRDIYAGDANESSDLPLHLMSDGLHVVEFKVHNRMAPSLTGRLKAGVFVMAGFYAAFWLIGGLVWWQQLPIWLCLLVWGKITLKGGVGNTGVAKQLSGVTTPWILTPYQLVKHIEKKREVAQASGWSE